MKSRWNGAVAMTLLCAGLLLSQAGCGSDDQPTAPGSSSRVAGRVTDEAAPRAGAGGVEPAAGVGGAAVTVARLDAGGELEDVTAAGALTGASGEFVVETGIETGEGARPDIVVVAAQGGTAWKAVVSGNLRHGATANVRPLTAASTLEAEIYARMMSQGKASAASYAELRAMVDAELAALVETNDVIAVNGLAAAVAAQAEAREAVATDVSLGAGETQFDAVVAAELEAAIALDAALHAAGGGEAETRAATEAWLQALLLAQTQAGAGLAAGAKSRQVAAAALAEAAFGLNAEVRAALHRRAALTGALLVAAATRAQFQALAAGEGALEAVADAGVLLRFQVESAADVEAIEAACAQYHDTIVAELGASLGAHEAGLLSADAEAGGALKTALETRLAIAFTTQDVVEAYLEYFAAVRAEVESSLAGAGAGTISAAAEALIAVNMYSGMS